MTKPRRNVRTAQSADRVEQFLPPTERTEANAVRPCGPRPRTGSRSAGDNLVARYGAGELESMAFTWLSQQFRLVALSVALSARVRYDGRRIEPWPSNFRFGAGTFPVKGEVRRDDSDPDPDRGALCE
jgi:hypothetical protein